MKKIITGLVLALFLPSLVLAYFQPATLTNGIDRVAVYTKAQADNLFSQGYVLEQKVGLAVGEYFSPVAFLGGMKHTEQIKTIAKTSVTATTTLTYKDSGTTFYLSASGTTINLPPVATAKGVTYRFVVGGALDSGNVLITSSEGDNIEGTLIVAGAVVDCDANDVVTFVVDGENLGDYVDLRSNGTKWFIGDSGALTASKLTCSG